MTLINKSRTVRPCFSVLGIETRDVDAVTCSLHHQFQVFDSSFTSPCSTVSCSQPFIHRRHYSARMSSRDTDHLPVGSLPNGDAVRPQDEIPRRNSNAPLKSTQPDQGRTTPPSMPTQQEEPSTLQVQSVGPSREPSQVCPNKLRLPTSQDASL